MEAVKFVQGAKVYLRPVEPDEDAKLVYFGKNHPLVRESLFLSAPMTLEQVVAEMNNCCQSRDHVLFTICDQANGTAIGQTAFVRIDHVSRAAIFYLAIYETACWSKGFGGEATALMVGYGFDVLNLNRIQLHVWCENDHAVKAYQKTGFRIEGTLQQAMYHNNRYCDFYVMAILREQFYAGVSSRSLEGNVRTNCMKISSKLA